MTVFFLKPPIISLQLKEDWSGCTVISDVFSETMRIPDGSSIFTSEAKAIDLTLDFIADCGTFNKFVIFSDSLSVLKSLDHTF